MPRKEFGNGLIQPRLKGLSGPFFEHYFGNTVIHTTGNANIGASAGAVTYGSVVVTKDAVEVTYTP
jgi:hypothetical protein